MILPGNENSFGGKSRYVAAHATFGDNSGRYPNYRIYMSQETTTGTFNAMVYGDNGNNGVGSTFIAPANDTTWMFTVYIVARRTDADNESAAYWGQGAIDNNAGTIAMVGATALTAIEDTAAWDVQVGSAGGSGLQFLVKGEVSKTIRWNGYVDIVQVSG